MCINQVSDIDFSMRSFKYGGTSVDSSNETYCVLFFSFVHEINLVHDDDISEFQLFCGCLCILDDIAGEIFCINQTDDTIESNLVFKGIHEEALGYRKRFRHSRSFNDDMVDFFITCKKSLHCGNEISTNNTTDASIADLYELFPGFYDQFCIDTFTTKFIFDDRDFVTMISSENMVEKSGFTTSEKSGKYGDGDRHSNFLTTLMTEAKHFEDMLFALKIMVMDALMRREEFFYRFTFSTDKKPMIFIYFMTCAGAPFSESGYVMHEFLFLEKFKNSIDRHSIHLKHFCYFIGCKSAMIFLKKREYFLTCFCLSHRRQYTRKNINAILLH